MKAKPKKRNAKKIIRLRGGNSKSTNVKTSSHIRSPHLNEVNVLGGATDVEGEMCAPNVESTIHIGSCFSGDALGRIVARYNELNPRSPIDVNNPPNVLWKIINERMMDKCKGNDEVCWERSLKIETNSYKPLIPKGKYEWLSSVDIERVMRQYELKYPDFKFIGPLPVDFRQIITELSESSIGQLYNKGIRRIGIIFNLDLHTGPGTHWVSLFADLTSTPSIEYFDSTADKPPKEIVDLMNTTISELLTSHGINVNKKINRSQHQFKDSECGVYSLNFVIQRLKGKQFEDIVNTVIKDEEMNKMRKKYFRSRVR